MLTSTLVSLKVYNPTLYFLIFNGKIFYWIFSIWIYNLINCCTIDWYTKWPDEALYSVALREYSANEHLGIADYKEALSDLSVSIHSDVYEYSE